MSTTTATAPATAPVPHVRRRDAAPLDLLRRAMREPGRAVVFGIAILKGYAYRGYCRLRGRRLQAGRGLAIYGRLSVRGPGVVVLGERVSVWGRVNLWTYAPEARLTIANDVMMSGTRMACAKEIRIGRECILADASLRDTDFHSVRADRRSPDAPIRVAPIHLEPNVWVASAAILLPGTIVGENSVVGAGAVCMRGFPANKVILGNPAKVAMPIPSIGGAAGTEPLAEPLAMSDGAAAEEPAERGVPA